MKTGLAIWHYAHRTPVENVTFFSRMGLDSVSLHGSVLDSLSADDGARLSDALDETNPVLTVHHTLPRIDSAASLDDFRRQAERASAWQRKYKKLAIWSFDVPDAVRRDITPYIRAALDAFAGEDTRIAVEDFGLNESELAQSLELAKDPRFGYLIDIGHLNIRLNGRPAAPEYTLFNPSPLECPRDLSQAPTEADFLYAFSHKPLPVFEVHLHNNDNSDDVHWFLENGGLDIPMIARVLKKTGYNGIVTIESAPNFRFPCAGREADEGIARTIAYWKDCLAKA